MRQFQDCVGLIAAAHTPFDSAGALALEVIEQQAQLFQEQGLIGVFVGGSTGEWFSLTLDERKALINAWASHDSDLHVIAHVGGVELEDAQALAACAQDAGVDAISCLAPLGMAAESPSIVVDYLQAVAAAAPLTPCMYYDMPSFTGIDIALDLLLDEAGPRVPTLAGAKYTHSDLATLTRARQCCNGRLQILMGRDEMLLGALATGVKAAVGSTYNYAAPVYQRIVEAVDQCDLDAARVANDQVVMFVKALVRVGVLPGAKAIMRAMGVDTGRPRPPHDTLTEAAAEAFIESVRDMPIFARPLKTCHS